MMTTTNWKELKIFSDEKKSVLTFHAYFNEEAEYRISFDMNKLTEELFKDLISGKYTYFEYEYKNGVPNQAVLKKLNGKSIEEKLHEYFKLNSDFFLINSQIKFNNVFSILLDGPQLSTTNGMSSSIRKKIQQTYYDFENEIVIANDEIATPFLIEQAGSMIFHLESPELPVKTISLLEKIYNDIENGFFDVDFYQHLLPNNSYYNIMEKLINISKIKEIETFDIAIKGITRRINNREYLNSINLREFLKKDTSISGTIKGLINRNTFTIYSNAHGTIHCKTDNKNIYEEYAVRNYGTNRIVTVTGTLIDKTINVITIT